MKSLQYTIRNISPELDAKLRAKASRERKSLNSVLLEQLERSVRKQPAGNSQTNDYDDLVGSWVADPDFDAAMKDMRTVNPQDWQ